MPTALWSIAAYALQLAALVSVAVAATWLMRIRAPRHFLRFWQMVLGIALLLPLAQPRGVDSSRVSLLSAGATFASITRPAVPIEGAGPDAATIVLIVIGIGAIARLAWLAAGLMRLRSIISTAIPDDSFTAITTALAATLGVSAELRVSDRIEGPATVGVRRPIVLLPPSVRQMTTAVQQAIICHELIHVRRRDWLQTIGEELLCAALWFHPLARLMASRVSLGREMVVDETTILTTRDRRAYAEALLAFSDPQPHVIGATPFIGRRTLSRRIAAIADERPMNRRRAVSAVAIALFSLLAITAASIERFPMFVTLEAQTVYRPGNGVSLPQVIKEVKPKYTAQAMQRQIQGSVWLECVVGVKGTVSDITITKSLDPDYGLDAEAAAVAKQWLFKPAQKDGKPVPVRITIEMTFTLKK
jgi:TonB family protein